ncbi:MAG: rhomboid family intramembrane serine protease [Gemmataceae bacterium]|nr:rhomboid family intramembrane serine protease [Gemmataceae bacterium]
MTTPNPSHAVLIDLLRAIAAADPNPWYPAQHVERTGLPRDAIDEPLALLRVQGFVRLTDWQPGTGQGYVLTMEGRRAVSGRAPIVESGAPPARPAMTTRPIRNSSDAVITRLLIAAQVGVFLLGLAQFMQRGGDLSHYLRNADSPLRSEMAVSDQAIRLGDWWTLLSYAFVHGNLIHLGFNLYGHVTAASIVERIFGRWRFAAVYFIAVWCGGVGAVLSSPRGATVGSSGGLCGIFAAEIVWAVMNRHLFREAEWQNIKSQFLSSVILLTVISMTPGVSWGGHLGGAIGGGLATALLIVANSGPLWRSILALSLVTSIPFSAFLFMLFRMT